MVDFADGGSPNQETAISHRYEVISQGKITRWIISRLYEVSYDAFATIPPFIDWTPAVDSRYDGVIRLMSASNLSST